MAAASLVRCTAGLGVPSAVSQRSFPRSLSSGDLRPCARSERDAASGFPPLQTVVSCASRSRSLALAPVASHAEFILHGSALLSGPSRCSRSRSDLDRTAESVASCGSRAKFLLLADSCKFSRWSQGAEARLCPIQGSAVENDRRVRQGSGLSYAETRAQPDMRPTAPSAVATSAAFVQHQLASAAGTTDTDQRLICVSRTGTAGTRDATSLS